MELARCFRHLNTTRRSLLRRFPPASLEAIEAAISDSESHHRGEIRFAIESSLDAWSALQGVTSRERAVRVFADLGVWDTAENSGVLIYVLLADQRVEILADRGYRSRVEADEWEQVCRRMEREFSEGRFGTGAVDGVVSVGALVSRSFPVAPTDVNELPDAPVIL